MSLSITRQIELTKDEYEDFKNWIDGFHERSPENAEKNISRAMKRRYGQPDYWISGNGAYPRGGTLSLGKFI